jgi:hypothetical protein
MEPGLRVNDQRLALKPSAISVNDQRLTITAALLHTAAK